MSDLEDQLRRMKLREVPDEWRAEILKGCATQPAAGNLESARGWREWLWPSPFAWGALAGIWIGLGIFHAMMGEGSAGADNPRMAKQETSVLLMGRDYQALVARLR